MSIKERLEAIAEALETASKQARLLAEEVEQGCVVTASDIGKAQMQIKQRIGVGAKRDSLKESQQQSE